MKTYIALLRGINVAGQNMVPMSDLRDMIAKLGYQEPRSLLQSGNLLFRAGERTTGQLERELEAQAAKRLGLETQFFVRSAQEWETIVARNPFRKEAESDPGHLILMCLKSAPKPEDVRALEESNPGRERIHAVGTQAYIVYPDGVGRSKLTNALIDKKLDTRCTGRNWNTVLKLLDLAAA